jgi:hypothetical protein
MRRCFPIRNAGGTESRRSGKNESSSLSPFDADTGKAICSGSRHVVPSVEFLLSSSPAAAYNPRVNSLTKRESSHPACPGQTGRSDLVSVDACGSAGSPPGISAMKPVSRTDVTTPLLQKQNLIAVRGIGMDSSIQQGEI